MCVRRKADKHVCSKFRNAGGAEGGSLPEKGREDRKNQYVFRAERRIRGAEIRAAAGRNDFDTSAII